MSAHRSDALEGDLVNVGEDVCFWVAEDLEGDGAVVVLERRDVVVAYGQLRLRVDLVPGIGRQTHFKTLLLKKLMFHYPAVVT